METGRSWFESAIRRRRVKDAVERNAREGKRTPVAGSTEVTNRTEYDVNTEYLDTRSRSSKLTVVVTPSRTTDRRFLAKLPAFAGQVILTVRDCFTRSDGLQRGSADP